MTTRLRVVWSKRRARVADALVLVLGSGLIFAAFRLTNRSPAISMADVKRGEFVDSLQLRGEVKALKSVTIAAPAMAGNFRILQIAQDGTPVKKGDTVVQFDKTKTEQDVAQYNSVLKATQSEIDQARARARLTEEEDITAVSKARYDVQTAKLEASKQEIVSHIDGEKAKLTLSDAEQKLREAEQKLASDRVASKSALASKQQASRKAQYDVQQAERSLAAMTLRAPADGTLTLVQHWRPDGRVSFKAGDQAWPGAPIADLPDLSTLRVSVRADETERGRLNVAQACTIQLDAVPDRQFTASISRIGTLASVDFSAGWPVTRNFDLDLAFDETDARLRPGMSAQVTVIVDRVRDALTIPAQALFQKSGRAIAYVSHGSSFEEREIEVGRRSGGRILVSRGLRPGDRVALSDPMPKE